MYSGGDPSYVSQAEDFKSFLRGTAFQALELDTKVGKVSMARQARDNTSRWTRVLCTEGNISSFWFGHKIFMTVRPLAGCKSH